MRKRKVQRELQTNNESITFDFNEPYAHQTHNRQQINVNKFANESANEQILVSDKKQPNEKTCTQNLKQKLEYFWFQMLNYLQFDQVFINQQIELLKREDYTIKTKYLDNYYLTYQERSKSFSISVQEIARMKMQEQRIKNKNFWSELKRLVCCQGGNELDENDEMLTTASQSEYFYLTKKNKNNRTRNGRQMTEQSLVQKPYSKMMRQERFHSLDQRLGNNIYSFGEQYHKENNNKSNKTTNEKNSQQIDLNNVKTVNKKHLEQQQSWLTQNTGKITTNHTNNNDERNDSKMRRNRTKDRNVNQQNFYQNITKSTSNDSTINNNKNAQKMDKNSLNHDENAERQKIKHQQTQAVYIQRRESVKDNQGSFTSNKNPNETVKNSNLQIQNPKGYTSTEQSSPYQSDQKFTPIDITLQSESNKHQDQTKNNQNFQFNHYDNSDAISVSHSQNMQFPNGKNKRIKKKHTKEEPLLDLKFVENLADDQSSQFQEDSEEIYSDRKKHSFSSQQLNKKSRKNRLNSNTFEEVEEVIKQGQWEDENERNKSLRTLDGQNTRNSMGDSESTPQVGKKKRARNKKLFNTRQQDEKTDQVIIFNENKVQTQTAYQNDSMDHAQTIDLGDLNSQRMSSSTNIKKRKKLKKLKDLNTENDQYNVIVLQGDEILQYSNNNQSVDINRNYSTINVQSHHPTLIPLKADKKRKKKARLRQQMQRQQQQLDVVDLGEINQ